MERTETYWEKLAREFKTCTHDNVGAYNSTRIGKIKQKRRANGIDEMRAKIRINEAGYTNWRNGDGKGNF